MKKILLIVFLIFASVTIGFSQNVQPENNSIDFYYIRARDFRSPSKNIRTDAGKILLEKGENKFVDDTLWNKFLDFCEMRLNQIVENEKQ